jgi:hypothetical protein
MNNTEHYAIRKNKSGMMIITLLIFIWASVGQSHARKYSDEGEKSFTFIQQFVYHHQKYEQVILADFLTEPLDVNNGPDRQLVRFLSSILADDFEWWLSHWSAETQQDWLDKISINKAQRTFNYWKARFSKKTEAQLIDFVVLGQRALVGVELKNSSTDYFLIAFAFENNRWRIDQPFMISLLYSKIKHKVRN